MKKSLLVSIVAGLLALGACGGGSSGGDDSHEARRPDRAELAEAYRRAYEQACEKFWANSPDGLYYGGVSHTVDDCLNSMPDVAGSEFLDEGDAARRGEDEGYEAAIVPPTPNETVCWGSDCWDESDQ